MGKSFDRSGYRAILTDAGRNFHARTRLALRELDRLQGYADQLSSGEETVLRIVIGDLFPRPQVLERLSRFFAERRRTRLHLDYEAVGGPIERLGAGYADLTFHRVDPSDSKFERIELLNVKMVPVAAPGFLPFAPSETITPEQMQPFTQCVIRDTAQAPSEAGFFLIEGAPQCSVPDQAMKKELILHGLAWGHLPAWLVEEELCDGRLISIAGPNLPGRVEQLAAIRRRGFPHGPVAEALWTAVKEWNGRIG